jgi:hypothetical protein
MDVNIYLNSKMLPWMPLYNGIWRWFYSKFCYRPGRMEVQIEIGLPDEKGRIQILSIHSNKMKENSFLSADVSLEELGTLLHWSP